MGFELFERRKGVKQAYLTPKGTEFYPIACSLLALFNDCGQLQERGDVQRLSIATADSLLAHVLAPLYRSIVFDDGPLALDVQLYPSNVIYSTISNNKADVGFTLYEKISQHVEVSRVFSNDVVVLVPSDSPLRGPVVHPRELDPRRELLISFPDDRDLGWGGAFYDWHDAWFDAAIEPLVRVNTSSTLSYFFGGSDFWAFLPRTAALGYAGQYELRVLELEVQAPLWTCYMLTNRMVSNHKRIGIDFFKERLDAYVPCLNPV